jgi:Ca2+/Na+ antiporter
VSIFNFVIGQPTDRPTTSSSSAKAAAVVAAAVAADERIRVYSREREREAALYSFFSLSFCAHFLFAALWVLALDPWPFFFFLGRASSSSWGSWALFILFYFVFFLFAGKRSQKAKKEKCRNGSSSRYMARGRTISTPSNKRNEKKVNDLLLLLLLRLGSRCVATTKTLGMPTAEERL